MKKPLHVLWCVALVFLTNVSVGQTIKIISNPDMGTGYTGPIFPTQTIIYRNELYSLYFDINRTVRLSKFDGTQITLISNPDSGTLLNSDLASPGFVGPLIVFNDALYSYYYDKDKTGRVAKFDGVNVTLLQNPDSGRGNPSGFFTVFNDALYYQYLDANGKYHLAKIEDSNTSFGITGVTGVNCTALSANQRKLTFTPQYTGLTGQPLSFSVVNELQSTNNAGPYSLTLYTDNPTIILKATQTGTPGEASYTLNWLASCGSARRAVTELQPELSVTVMPNPSTGPTVDVLVQGAAGQPVTFQVTDERGNPVSQLRVEQSDTAEQATIRLGSSVGIYFLKVTTPTQVKTVKVVRK